MLKRIKNQHINWDAAPSPIAKGKRQKKKIIERPKVNPLKIQVVILEEYDDAN